MKYLIAILFLVGMVCFFLANVDMNDYCKIEQNISIHNYKNRTYTITTYIVTYNFIGTMSHAENFNYAHGIKASKIDSVKYAEYRKICPSLIMINRFIKNEYIE